MTERNTTKYTGWLKRGADPDTIVGEIKDAWGWVIRLTGKRDPAGGYVLEGELGEAPKALRVAAIDGEP